MFNYILPTADCVLLQLSSCKLHSSECLVFKYNTPAAADCVLLQCPPLFRTVDRWEAVRDRINRSRVMPSEMLSHSLSLVVWRFVLFKKIMVIAVASRLVHSMGTLWWRRNDFGSGDAFDIGFIN